MNKQFHLKYGIASFVLGTSLVSMNLYLESYWGAFFTGVGLYSLAGYDLYEYWKNKND